MLSLTITSPSDSDQRIDKFIKKYLKEAPLWGIYKWLRTGKIKVNRKKVDQTYRIDEGDVIEIYLSDDEIAGFQVSESSVNNSNQKNIETNGWENRRPLDILYEDKSLMIVNKPPGINVHPWDHKTKEVSLIEQVQDYLDGRYNTLSWKPSLVHRIDRDTSGVIMIAKEKKMLESLLDLLQSGKIEKIYHTIVIGTPEKPRDTIRAKLLRKEDAQDESKVIVSPLWQEAITHYRILKGIRQIPRDHQKQEVQGREKLSKWAYEWVSDQESFSSDDGIRSFSGSLTNIRNKYSLVECHIETGRMHQIRVHLASIGIPVLWDKAYGDKWENSFARREYGITRQLLHAYSLSFEHPKTGEVLSIRAAYQSDMQNLLEI